MASNKDENPMIEIKVDDLKENYKIIVKDYGIGIPATDNNNIFENNGVEVEIATIHSVKGETHIATLYLETSYQGEHESQRIMEQLKGNYYVPPRKKDVYKKETLKMTHVGMSRPKYFLCMAIHRDRFDDALDINNGGIWEIVNA